ncbi:hypothetical protein [Vibrio sp. TRT 29B02]|uniref:hypothetical protein n=1 Tax=Vibrio sp. TRT 29B02 TaxID=3418508 RepID=UPI003CF13CE4
MRVVAKSITGLIVLVSNSVNAQAEGGDRIGFGIYRLAVTVDAGTSALFNFMFLVSIFLMIASLVVLATGHKNNLPKSLAAVMAVISLFLASPTLYQSIAAKTVLNNSNIDAIEFLENGSKTPMNEEVF